MAAPPAAGGGAEAARRGAAAAPDEVREALPPSMAARISCLLMWPPAPVPGICARSTLFSRARRRTSGELRIFSPLGRCGCADELAAGDAAVARGAGDGAGFGASDFGGAGCCRGGSALGGGGG